MYSLFVGGFGIKGFFRSFFVVDVLWVYSLSGGFFRFSLFVKGLGVRTLLRVLWFGVSEVSRFKCRRVSSGLVFQFERFGYQMILRFSWQRVVFQGKYFRLSEV